jgi:hypothetical protein
MKNRLKVAVDLYGMDVPGGRPPGEDSAARARLHRAARRGELGTKPVLPGFEISRTTALLDASGSVIRETIEQRPERGGPAQVPEGHVVKGISTLVDAEGRKISEWIKTREDRNPKLIIDSLLEGLAPFRGAGKRSVPPRSVADDLTTIYPIADHHLGMFSWARETGSDYDLAIAERELLAAARQLVDLSPPAETAVILNLGDFFHGDDSKNQTPRSGNALDVDTRYPKVLVTGVRLMREVIDLARRKHRRVVVRNLPGNHDPHAAFALTAALSCYFETDTRVTVDDDPSLFFWHRFGKNLIFATHGHALKAQDVPGYMAATRPKEWGGDAVSTRLPRSSSPQGSWRRRARRGDLGGFPDSRGQGCTFGRPRLHVRAFDARYHLPPRSRGACSLPRSRNRRDSLMRKMIIGLAGRAGAGKSTAARILREELGFTVLPFAEPLKRMALAMGLTEQQAYGDAKELPFEVPLARIDRDVARTALRALPFNCWRRGATPFQMTTLTTMEIETAIGSLVEWDRRHHHALTTPRRVMQLLGTEWGRDMIGPEFWADVWRQSLTESAVEHFGDILVVADDCRFINEATAIRAEGGIVCLINRSGAGSESGSDHSSERMGFEPDVTIWNDGPEDVLRARMHGVLDRYWSSEALLRPQVAVQHRSHH